MRRKKFGQLSRFALAMAMICFLIFDTSMAGCFRRYLRRQSCAPVPACVTVCQPTVVYCEPVQCQPPVCCVPTDCCGSTITSGGPAIGHSDSSAGEIVGGSVVDSTDASTDEGVDAAPSVPTLADEGDVDSDTDGSAFSETDDAGAAGADSAADEGLSDDISPPDDFDTEPNVAAEEDDAAIFTDTTPDDADATGDDFGSDVDAFDDPATTDEMEEDPVVADPADDGFGDVADPATTDDDGIFDVDPIDDGADATDDGFLDEDPAIDTTEDDGFFDTDDATTPDEDSLDDIFDDGARVAPIKEGFREVKTVAARRSADLPYRLWTDNTGEYRTVGRLVQITRTHVKLLKDNGKHSTVSKTRLSKEDLAYAKEMERVIGVRDNFDAIALR